MNPYLTARRTPALAHANAQPAMARIDLVLALYDGAIERIHRAIGYIRVRNRTAAVPLIARTQLIITELAAGVRVEFDYEMGTNYQRLYEFVVDRLKGGREMHLTDALHIMTTLREGFAKIRDEAIALERRGDVPSADRLLTLSATA